MGERAAHRGGWDITTVKSRGPGPGTRRTGPTSSGVGGVALRAPARPQDGRLDPIAERWFATFAGRARPTELCRQYPRVANRLALCWADPGLSGKVLQDLLTDKRGGRRGFPAPIRAELLALKDLADTARRRKASQWTAPLHLERAY